MTPSDKKLISRDKGHIFDSSVKLANGKYVKYVPSGAISLSRPNMTPSDKKLISRDKGHIFDSSVKLANGKYIKYVPSGLYLYRGQI